VTPDKQLRRDLTPDEVAEETKGIDETLPEALTAHRRPLATERAVGAIEHRSGEEEEEPEEDRGGEAIPAPEDPPRRYERPEGAE
jgi:hypothetical protein